MAGLLKRNNSSQLVGPRHFSQVSSASKQKQSCASAWHRWKCFIRSGFSSAVTSYSSLPFSLIVGDTPSARDTRLSTANSASTYSFRSGTSGRAAKLGNLCCKAVPEYARELGLRGSRISLSHGGVRAEHFRHRAAYPFRTDGAIRAGLAPVRIQVLLPDTRS